MKSPAQRCRSSGLFLLLALARVAAQPMMPPERVVFPAPLSPAESLATIRIPAGMQIELVASEPAVMDPIDIAWGADGRMWVVEMADYPLGLDAQGTVGGRVRVLESTRADGRYDKSTLFAAGLRFPASAVPWRDGVIVAAAPDILFLQDTDGDGRADRTTKLFTNLGQGNQQHMANGLQWGLDGWLYVANGGTRGEITSVKTGETFEMGRDVRIQPDEGIAQPLTGRTQFGRNRDDWGNWFGNQNTNPFWHYALEDHYLRRNPHLAPPNAVVHVPEIPGAARVYPVSETVARFNSPRGANHFTSACSPVIYRDDFLGPDYEGNVFISESVHNLVHREIVTRRGTTFTSRRAPDEQTSEFLASSDNWARFVNMRAGPDGALYIVDMYRLVIEHPQYIPAAWMKELGDERLRAGEKQGRIYRVYPRGKPLRPVARLDQADAAGLVAALESPSGTVRDLAQQQLGWRKERKAAVALEKLLGHARPQTRVQALCTLDLLGGLTPAHLGRALADSHPGVRRQAVRLTEAFSGKAPELLDAIIRLAGDGDASVRQQVAYTLGEWKHPSAGAALVRLTRQAEDPFVIAAALSSATPHLLAMIAQLDFDAGIDRTLIDMVAAGGDRTALLRILQAIVGPGDTTPTAVRFTALSQFLEALRRNRISFAQLQASGSETMAAALRAANTLAAAARGVVLKPEATPETRVAALGLLGREPAEQPRDLELLAGLLAPRYPAEVQLAATEAMRRFTLPAVPHVLLRAWNTHGPQLRNAILDVLTSRPSWAGALLDRIEADRTMLPQIDAAHREGLARHADRAIAARATTVLAAGLDANRQRVVDRYTAALTSLKGDAKRGLEVFKAACAACHKFGDTAGGAIGPDLAGISDRSADYLIVHVLDPNRVVESRFLLYSAVRHDGRALSGMIATESGGSLTLVGLDGAEQIILRSDLKTLESTGRSLMPEGLEAAIAPQQMSDLVAFLADGTLPHPPRPARKGKKN